MYAGLADLLNEADQHDNINVVLLHGAGDSFTAGNDLEDFAKNPPGPSDSPQARLINALIRFSKPLVAAVNGDAHAGGFSLIALCDLAVCAEDATLGLPETAHGLFPLLALAIVKDSLPQKVFFDLVYRARLLNASEARSLHSRRWMSLRRNAE